MKPLTQAQKQLLAWLVEYKRQHEPSPSIREMVSAMGLKSNSAIQHRLQGLHDQGYIDWIKTRDRHQHRTEIHLLPPAFQVVSSANVVMDMDLPPSLPILGTIAAGGLVESFADEVERFELKTRLFQPGCFALRVMGDSMVEAHIVPDDIVILRSVTDASQVKDGAIVAARVAGSGTTLKRFYQSADQITLQAANPIYPPIQIPKEQLELLDIQGVLVGIWRETIR